MPNQVTLLKTIEALMRETKQHEIDAFNKADTSGRQRAETEYRTLRKHWFATLDAGEDQHELDKVLRALEASFPDKPWHELATIY
jgi:hypothetical protein